MKRLQAQESSPGVPNRGTKGAVSEISQSTMDLSMHKPDKNHIPAPRFQASVSKEKSGEHLWYSFSYTFVQDLAKMFPLLLESISSKQICVRHDLNVFY